ncbi:hypothetical protein WA026_005561 [Henosepilachna vigintioctopunctata]|uniref:DZF domain-containing protein n=1 Tax=Henosepilachna vigintioctopunctata TaxID=420089 RepID=A0AAW1TWR2_9CUCU
MSYVFLVPPKLSAEEVRNMATNNYFGFTHGGTQYSAQATGAAYQAASQAGYAVATPATAAAAAATYGTQRPTGYDTAAYQAAAAAAAPGATYAAVSTGGTPSYDYGYGYDQTAAAKTATYATTYTQRPTATQPQVQAAAAAVAKPAQYSGTYQANPAGYQATYSTQTTIAAQPTTQAKPNSTTTYSGYDAALYSAATMYVAQQTGAANQQKAVGWQGYKKGGVGGIKNLRTKAPPKPQQLHYCDVCKISCAGPQTYREHLEGQKHKKREAATKMTASVAVTSQNRAGNSLRCQLCDVTCTGNDAYAAHIRGAKHQKVVLLHTKLGKPIPPQEPEVIGGARNGDSKEDQETEETPEPDIQPVGQDYIEEIKSEDGKVISFNCKLCECRFNDPNAKEMHMKGRRHRLQYKKKVDPQLVVDVKPSLKQRRIQEEKARRTALREEFWARRHYNNMAGDEEDRLYWEDRRRFEEEYMVMYGHGNMPFPRGRIFPGGAPPPGLPVRRAESSDDRHVMARHTEIYPKEEELQAIQRIVSHTERALKMVSDQLAEEKPADGATSKPVANKVESDEIKPQQKEDGRDNQLFSFQQNRDANRMLKGVMRVGHLAKGLLLRGDTKVELVVLCDDKPTLTLLRKVVSLVPGYLKQVAPDVSYTVTINAAEAGMTVSADDLTVLVQLTSPVMRDQGTGIRPSLLRCYHTYLERFMSKSTYLATVKLLGYGIIS